MTCIVGYLDKENDCVWIGGDSLGSNGFSKSVYDQTKIFRNENLPNVAMGGTSTFRHLDLLRYADGLFEKIDKYEEKDFDHKYMVTKFIPKVIYLFDNGIKSEDSKEKGGNFIIGIKNKLYEIQGDYSVLEPNLGFCSVGCGVYTAMGSLVTTKDMSSIPIPKRIEMALTAAEECCCGVQRPFRIINTKDDKEIIIK